MKFVVSLVLVAFASGIKTTGEYDFKTTFLEGEIELFWTINNDVITFEVHGHTMGWVGIGLSPKGQMKGSDIYIGWVADNRTYLTDRHGLGHVVPRKDPETNVELISGSENDGWTILKFRRNLISPDEMHDRNITTDTQRIIFALGNTDPTEGVLSSFSYHGWRRRGVKSLQLVKQKVTFPENETYNHIDIVQNNFEIPATETYYSCVLFKLPDIKEKHHVVQVEPMIKNGNEKYVHHLTLSSCQRDHFVPPENWEEPFLCRTYKHPPSCGKMIMGWAVGGETFKYPNHVGMPIFGDGDEYFLLEIHYDNPERMQGVRDSSGLRMKYTSSLRKYDAGVLGVGLEIYSLGVYIPPGSPNFLYSSHCSSDCLTRQLGGKSIYVFGDLLHTHLAGKGVRLRHFRNGTELPMIAKDDSYDFNFQQYRLLPKEVEIRPTDHLEVDCYYDTVNRKTLTVGGESTRQEMCFAFILYYPETSSSFCQSRPNIREIFKFLNVTQYWFDYTTWQYTVIEPREYKGKTFLEYMNLLDWTPTLIKEFSQAQRKMSQLQYCYRPLFHDVSIFRMKMPKGVLDN